MNFHAHIYYTEETKSTAKEVRQQVLLQKLWDCTVGDLRDEPIGPHPQPMFQISFVGEEFSDIVQWLMFNREGLIVLIHPRTTDELLDHTLYSMWMGKILTLDLTKL